MQGARRGAVQCAVDENSLESLNWLKWKDTKTGSPRPGDRADGLGKRPRFQAGCNLGPRERREGGSRRSVASRSRRFCRRCSILLTTQKPGGASVQLHAKSRNLSTECRPVKHLRSPKPATN